MFDPQVEMGHTVLGPRNRLGLQSVSSKDYLQTQEDLMESILVILLSHVMTLTPKPSLEYLRYLILLNYSMKNY